eukprot:TRINITY_DN111815_c0_g1_i1.p1 TRINITY_DN111815_c0_g1~~TRINITY_DN111815_c0_g1_i1.p1  ORF type:complete len:287 (+),score=32.83 TRINITY_DN111815_c0_g1_i1:114-974(+)
MLKSMIASRRALLSQAKRPKAAVPLRSCAPATSSACISLRLAPLARGFQTQTRLPAPLSRLTQRWRLLRLRHSPVATYGLIGANVTMFGLYNVSPERANIATPWRRLTQSSEWSLRSGSALWSWLPYKDRWERHCIASYHAVVRQHRFETLPLCTFMHADGMHLLFNMVTLFFVGRQVEQIIGTGRFLLFYLTAGTAAATAQVLNCYDKCLGASGGVYAQLGFLTCLMPWMTVYLYMVLPIPMWLLTSGVLLLDVFYMRPDQGHIAHLSGAAFGAAFWALRLLRWR